MGLRVAYLTHYAEAYGANRSLLDLVLASRANDGVEPFVILAADGPLCGLLEAHGITHAVVPFVPWMHKRVFMGALHHRAMQWWRHRQQARERARSNAKAVHAMVQWCKDRNIELVHVNSAVISVGPALSDALGVPWVWHIRELPFHHYAFHVDGGMHAYRAALRKATTIIAVSEAVRTEVLRNAEDPGKMRVVYDGIFTEERRKRLLAHANERWSAVEPFTFILAGLFHPSKGQLEAVEALAQLHAAGVPARLLLVGDGRMAPVVQRIQELGLKDHVILPGFVDPVDPWLLKAHCALTCSRYEAYGRATLEALASGIPVIGHASGGTVELIAKDVTGMLYTTPEELVACMLQLVRSPQRARELGASAMRSDLSKRTLEAMANDVVHVYWTVLGRTSH